MTFKAKTDVLHEIMFSKRKSLIRSSLTFSSFPFGGDLSFDGGVACARKTRQSPPVTEK